MRWFVPIVPGIIKICAWSSSMMVFGVLFGSLVAIVVIATTVLTPLAIVSLAFVVWIVAGHDEDR